MGAKIMAQNVNCNNMVVFLGGNDAEMNEIRQVLIQNGIETQDKNLGWGAKASAYAEEIAAAALSGKTVVTVELERDIELPEGSIEVDHHGDRSSEPASILQVLSLLGLEPTRMQLLLAANDSGFIPAMLAQGATQEEVAAVRLLDRQAQGITPEQEAEAERAISVAETINGVTVVRMAHSKCATVTDRLFDPNKPQCLLILSGDGESNFYGERALCEELKGEKTGTAPAPWDPNQTIETFSNFGGWTGGGEETGFWGGYGNQDDILAYVTSYFAD